MNTFFTVALTLTDVFTSKTAKDYYAGALTIAMAVLVAELILGVF